MGAYGQAIGAVLGIVGTGVQLYGQYKQLKAEREWAYQEAANLRKEGYARARAVRRRGDLEQGRMATAIGKSGVRMEGSPLELMAQNEFEIEYEALDIRRKTLYEAKAMEVASRNKMKAARIAAWSSWIGAFSSALGGGGLGGVQQPNQQPTGQQAVSGQTYDPGAYRGWTGVSSPHAGSTRGRPLGGGY